MARIKDYELDRELELQDRVLGTDNTNSGTMNFSLEQLGEFLASRGLADPSALDYQFRFAGQGAPTAGIQPGEIYYDELTPAGIRILTISITDLKGEPTGPFASILDGTVVEINDTQASQGTNYGFFEVTADPDFVADESGYAIPIILHASSSPLASTTDDLPQTEFVNLGVIGLTGSVGGDGLTPVVTQPTPGEFRVTYTATSGVSPGDFEDIDLPDGIPGDTGDSVRIANATTNVGDGLTNTFDVEVYDPLTPGSNVSSNTITVNPGNDGDQGAQGLYTLNAYLPATSAPTTPADTTFNITNPFSSTNGVPATWSEDPTTPTSGEELYQIVANVNPANAVANEVTLDWSDVFIAGAQGVPGDSAGFASTQLAATVLPVNSTTLGTASVVPVGSSPDTAKQFTFNIPAGLPGGTGAAAGFASTQLAATVAPVDSTTLGTASVVPVGSSPDTAKQFTFNIPSGLPGGNGDAGGFASTQLATTVAPVDSTTLGTASVVPVGSSPNTAKQFTFNIPSGLPGTTGDAVGVFYSTAATGGTISALNTYSSEDFIRIVTYTAGTTPATPGSSDVFTRFIGIDGGGGNLPSEHPVFSGQSPKAFSLASQNFDITVADEFNSEVTYTITAISPNTANATFGAPVITGGGSLVTIPTIAGQSGSQTYTITLAGTYSPAGGTPTTYPAITRPVTLTVNAAPPTPSAKTQADYFYYGTTTDAKSVANLASTSLLTSAEIATGAVVDGGLPAASNVTRADATGEHNPVPLGDATNIVFIAAPASTSPVFHDLTSGGGGTLVTSDYIQTNDINSVSYSVYKFASSAGTNFRITF